jgi:hypothetical protein
MGTVEAMAARLRLLLAAGVIAPAIAGCGAALRPVPVLDASTSDGVTFAVAVDACGDDLRVELNQGVDAVGIFVHVPSREGGGCTVEITVTLDRPLGQRDLVDGYDFSPIPIRVEPGPGPDR